MKKVLWVLCILLLSIRISNAQNKPKGKIHGYMFGDYFYNVARDSNSLSNAAFKGDEGANGFQFRRIYFGYDYNISETFSTRIRLEANQKENTSGGKIGMFVKDAYLKWKGIFKGTDAVIGFSPPPTFAVSEKYWGYRSLMKTIMDLRKIASSRDLGIALKGKVTESGSLKYWVMVGNGESNKPENDKQKRVYAHLNFAPIKNVNITLYGDMKFKENIPSLTNPSEELGNTVSTMALFIGYKQKGNFSLGVESFYQTFQNELGTVNGLESKNSIGISLFGSKDFSEKLSIVGRYDYFELNSNSTYIGDTRNLMLAALNYKVNPKFWIMPNIVIENYESLEDGTTFDSSVTARLTFCFKFK